MGCCSIRPFCECSLWGQCVGSAPTSCDLSAVTLSELVCRYPEFECIVFADEKSKLWAEKILEEAKCNTNCSFYGKRSAQAVLAQAAMKLAHSLCGRQAGFVAEDGSSAYQDEYGRLRSSGIGAMVI